MPRIATAGPPAFRTRPDRCPGVTRPWPADDGLLVRVRLIGGRLPTSALRSLAGVSRRFGDGDLHLTSRANLQLRGLPDDPWRDGDRLHPEVVAAIEATGLLPARRHELVRNVLVSPQTGRAGGRADLRPVAAELDRLLCADARLAALPGRFLFVLDDGRGDLLETPADLGLVVLDDATAQLRVGDRYGAVLPLTSAAPTLVALAGAFLDGRGTGADAPWHVRELAADAPLGHAAAVATAPDRRLPHAVPPLPYGPVPGGRHVEVPGGVLEPHLTDALLQQAGEELVVTPWHGVWGPEAGR